MLAVQRAMNGGSQCTSGNWETVIEDLVPLSTQLVPPALAEAFEIPTHRPPQQPQAGGDHPMPQADFAQRAQFLRGNPPGTAPQLLFPGYFPPTAQQAAASHQAGMLGAGGPFQGWLDSAALPSAAQLQQAQAQAQAANQRQPEANLGSDPENGEDTQARALKRPRLVWTAQLHQRFVDAVQQLGLKNAVPKTIMQLMNVDGLTRENVASHLQKYRLQLRKEEGRGGAGGEEAPEPPAKEEPEEPNAKPAA